MSDVFTVSDTRYAINGDELRRKREAKSIPQADFARACGWTRQYQWRLENGLVETVCEATKRVIEKELE